MTRTSTVSVEVKGAKALDRALRALGEQDAPFVKEAIEEGAMLLAGASARRAPGSMGRQTEFAGIRGSGGRIRGLVVVRHPGAKSMEFGRRTYYRGFHGRRQKATGMPFRASRGQPARPFVGILRGGAAIGEVEDDVKRILVRAIEAEWDRIARKGD